MTDQPRQQVYVIGAPGSRVVKIGRSSNLPERLKAIQRMSPLPLVILGSFSGGSSLESALHRHFRSLRTHGEWFDFGEIDPVSTIEAAVALGEDVLNHRGCGLKNGGIDQPRSWPKYDQAKPHWGYPAEPEPGRCACGHQAGSHFFEPPHPCGGEVPFNGVWCENYCLCGKYDDSPATYARVRATHPRHSTEWAIDAPYLDTIASLGPDNAVGEGGS
ncbi:GIY-YIG nuclease family protein [Streptomyces mayteni]